MKRMMYTGALVTLVTASAYAQATPPATQQNAPRTQTDQRTMAAPAMSADQQLVVDGAKGNMAEIALGKLAVERGTKADVKQFGQKMVTDHTKANEDLKMLAQSENIPWPTDMDAKHKETIDRISKLSGAAFDRAYMDQMVEDHTAKITKLRAAQQTVTDPEIKAWVMKAMTTPQEHLKMAQSISTAAVGTSGTK